MPIIEREIRAGKPWQAGNYELIPLSQVYKVQAPGMHAGLIWNRPKAVIVRTSDGLENTLPIRDVTRLVIWSMLAGGLIGAIFIGLTYRRK